MSASLSISACHTPGSRYISVFDADEVAARPALDEVAGDGERPAAEADQRLLGTELARGRSAPPRAPGANASSGIGHAQPLDVGDRRRPAAPTTGPTPSTSSTSSPMPSTGVTMSAKSTAASTPCRRTGWSVTSAQSSGVLGDLEERVALAERAVLRQRAAGLAHEPHRRALDRLAPQRADEERLGHAP